MRQVRAILLTSVLFGLPGCIEPAFIAADAIIEVIGAGFSEPEPAGLQGTPCHRDVKDPRNNTCAGLGEEQ